ncbi:Sporulation related domain-containing protein [Faunimonas pinastri]|uniref:Sporulation related domain-containing protein n=1 Tax=Faunimonas pinastri TaxID=1855383 RepID=A0A1H8ZYP8_9HYPH|nr:lytic transglycosylase domain-containing protein [Faunimonas pinastri]SEP69514.1 Sporulation related domain-containing protein [Faunimonas pinastri]
MVNAETTTICNLIEAAAKQERLPSSFLTRLIWKESSFKTGAVSPAGAQGIAQFMPGTADERGLDDPFDPVKAIPASAHFLRELADQFGNLGLAAAAYNGGPRRVADWVSGKGELAWETRDYVMAITGHPVEEWSKSRADAEPADPAGPSDCKALAVILRQPDRNVTTGIRTAYGPWGVQVVGNFSQARAISLYRRLQGRYASVLGGRDPMIVRTRNRGRRAFWNIRVPTQSRTNANELCDRIHSVGGFCAVLHN